MTPEQLDVLWQRGQQQEAQGFQDGARATYREILAGSPRQLMVQIRLSELELQAGRYRIARMHAMAAADTLSQTRRWEGLAFVTANLLAFDERERVLQLIRQPEWDDARVLRQSPVLTQQLWLCGDDAGALRLLDVAVRRVGDDHRLAYSRAMALQHLGRIDEATAAFERCIALAPDFALAHWSLAYHARSAVPGERIERLRSALVRAGQPQERAMLHYALYKELDAAGQRDAAWKELSEGAAIMHGLLGYSPGAFEGSMAALLAEGAPPEAGDPAPGETPIFIVGMPRTGTTLLSRILGAHPAVADAGELGALEHAIAESIDRFVELPLHPAILEEVGQADPRAIAAAYQRRTREFRRQGITHVIDKNPMNVFAAGVIARAMPQARVLCLVRGGMDTCYSNLRQLFQNGAFAYSYDQRQLADRYAAFRRLVDQWQQQLPGNFLAVSYEALVRDPLATAGHAMAFCGLGFDPAYVDISRNETPSATASAVQVRQPIHAEGIGEWRRYEAGLDPLAARLRELGFAP